MKLFVFLCIAVSFLTLNAPVGAQDKKPAPTLSAVDQAHIMQDTFVVSRTTTAIPDSVKQVFLSSPLNIKFSMAEPGHSFNDSDMIDPRVPLTRLMFVATSKSYCLLHYEHGGYGGVMPSVAVFRLEDTRAVHIYNYSSLITYSDMEGLRLALEQEENKQHVMQDAFAVSYTTAAIPDTVKGEFARQQQQTQFRMDEPVRKFHISDIAREQDHPQARLIFVATSKECCVLHYKYVGDASFTETDVFRLSGGAAYLVYRTSSSQAFSNMTDLRWNIREGAWYGNEI